MAIALLIVLEVVIFVVLVTVLKRVLMRNMASATQHLDGLNEDYARREEDISRRLREADKKAQDIVSKAQGEAERLKLKTIKDAREEKDRILQQAHLSGDEMIQQADKSRQLLISELDEKISKAAVEKACEIVKSVLPEGFKHDMHLQWVQELVKTGFANMDRLRIPEDTKEIKITSAFALTEDERKPLAKKLKEALNHDIVIKEEVDPNLVAGLVITIGSLILDGSLKNKIQEHVKSA